MILINSYILKNPDVTAPTITSSSTVSVDENANLAHALTASETVSWSIVGGADAAEFEISGSTLRFASNGTRDYEAPTDADTDNDYVVDVRATDLATNTTDQTITVTVDDLSEGVVNLDVMVAGLGLPTYVNMTLIRQYATPGAYINEA